MTVTSNKKPFETENIILREKNKDFLTMAAENTGEIYWGPYKSKLNLAFLKREVFLKLHWTI